MAVLAILRLGHPALRTAAQPVPAADLGSQRLERLVEDLFETLEAFRGAGLAAPQVGVLEQVFVLAAGVVESTAPRFAVVNPLISFEGHDWAYDWEGCLSIPDLRGLVPRHLHLRLQGWTPNGASVDLRLEGFSARVVQHEYDHLNGVLFLDRMRDLQSLAFRDEWLEHVLGRGPEASDIPLP